MHDGATPVLVVDIGRLGEWQARLAQNGIPVAPSCVDTRLLAAVHAVLPQIARLQGGGMLAAYNALDDAIVVRGVDRDVLIAALIEVVPDAERAVLDAIAAGTLRIDPRKMDVLRLNPWTFS